MKKVLAVFLALVMMSACTSVVASALDLSGVAPEDVNIGIHESQSEKGLFDNVDVETSDKVAEENGVLTVETDYGLVFTFKTMEGVGYLTQDLRHDLMTYLSCYSEPVEQARGFIEDDMHLNIFTTTNDCLDIYIYSYEESDTLSEIIQNANDLTDSDAATIAEILGSAYEVKFEYGLIGDQMWFVGNLLEDYNALLGVTYVGGHRIDAAIHNIASDDDIDTVMNMMASVSLSMK